jgi:hypothetical protein
MFFTELEQVVRAIGWSEMIMLMINVILMQD